LNKYLTYKLENNAWEYLLQVSSTMPHLEY
jgi:hypothetical protein